MEPTTFAELGLSAKVTAAVEAAGYTTPTPIQAQAIPVAVTGKDILGIAQTGTGKTAAFVMPMITRLEAGRARARMPRSLILAPTRELATQVAQSFEKYGINHKLNVALLIGGVSMDDQVRKLDRGADVLIATPGRLLDHFGRGRIMLMGVEILVIDEADRMLDMGFIPDIEKICKLLPPRRQTLFFSATMPPEITRLSEQFLTDPVRIEVAKPATTAKTITQRFYYLPGTEDWEKREALREIMRGQTIKNAIIFCNRKRDVAILHKSLLKHGYNAGALHGDMDQTSRTATLDKFRAGELTLLAASDVAARGLDIPDVGHVFNFDVPWQPDDYVHRIGRTGRAGREGFSATLVTPEDIKSMQQIAKLIGEEPVWLNEPPTEQELAEGAKRRRGRGGKSAGGGRDGRSAGRGEGRAESRGDSGRSSPGRDRPRGDRDRSRTTATEAHSERAGEVIETIGGGLPDERAERPRSEGRERPRDSSPREGRQQGDRPRDDRPRRRERSRHDGVRAERRDSHSADRPPLDRAAADQSIETSGRNEQPRAQEPRPERARSPQPRVDRPHDEQPREARYPDRVHDERPRDDRPRHTRGRDDQPREARDRDDRPRADRSSDVRPRDDRPRTDRPRDERPREDRPREDRPQRQPRDRAPQGERGVDRPQQPNRQGRGEQGRGEQARAETGTAFADNLPAFLRRPVR